MEASKDLIEAPDHRVTKDDLDDYLFGTDTKLDEKQKKLFYAIALSNNLNPIKREIYAVKYGNNFNIITGYEVYLRRADRTGLLDGWEATVDGEGDKMVATCTVWRKDRQKSTTIQAWFPEYNTGQSLWKTKPKTMLRKVAIAQAFRMSFPDELGGMPYTSDEIGEVIQAEVVPEKKLSVDDSSKKKRSSHQEAHTKPDAKSKALSACQELGYSQEDMEGFVNVKYEDWGEEELSQIRSWYRQQKESITSSPSHP